MLCFLNPETEPAWNLAAEEYVFRTSREDCFLVWRNRRAVVVGRNQNAAAEIDADFADRHHIPLLRRMSGGGAVYHDLGNVNFTRIDAGGDSHTLDFQHYTRPIVDFLNRLGVRAVFSGRSDLSLHGKKISGNAQYRHRDKVLHHGTLLFDANLHRLAEAIGGEPSRYRDKAVQSLRQRVTNIRPHLAEPLSTGEFMERLLAFVQKLGNGRQATFSTTDRQAIDTLAEDKYRRWHWNFGHSPPYEFSRRIRTGLGALEVYLQVEKGLIQTIRIDGTGPVAETLRTVAEPLIGCRHSRKSIVRLVSSPGFAVGSPPVPADTLVSMFF